MYASPLWKRSVVVNGNPLSEFIVCHAPRLHWPAEAADSSSSDQEPALGDPDRPAIHCSRATTARQCELGGVGGGCGLKGPKRDCSRATAAKQCELGGQGPGGVV